ncbi:type I methionyl aminopeptidase [Actinoalloteichus hymeniacidonis]|uniref:Methionine aminopeptidase n=1 Tax=Actinoalloteichus hymeniacidonis TaxID=340345 RepID=A0AAC9MWS4_9PSEU|nr:type I methionyl aminopeptidase [Actinoalloteichus hymeniacidonis]AOS61454.1 methionine aminopeptidase, type I [Actinoalloteichus hymeniacidonis]MBB5910540.1 methionyl aminopeptidase [Actinoalloteichus hymeniacidonis]
MLRRGNGIQLKTKAELEAMRAAGLIVAGALQAVTAQVRPGISTGELDEVAEQFIRDAGAVPSFKGYHGFPGSICASVNEQVVHGIPSRELVLADGDLLSVDCGAILEGWHGDSAVTVPVGTQSAADALLSEATRLSMLAGIEAVRAGNRLGDVSWAIEVATTKAAERDDREYGIVEGYGGHGIGTEMHMEPFIANHGRPNRGPKLKVGMALAIEPMLTLGTAQTRELDDEWTVVTADGSRAAHWEHSVAITEDGPWVLTAPAD